MYVDEVSVYSLMASRIGALPSEFTEMQQIGYKDSSQASVNVGLDKSPIRAMMGGASERSQSASSQVVKKSSIQTTFKELYDFERGRFLLMPSSDYLDGRPPTLKTSADLLEVAKSRIGDTWVVPAESVVRGELIELEVRIVTDDLYRMSAIFSTLSDLVTDAPSVFPGVVNSSFRDAIAVNKVIGRLLTGLIPLRAEAVDYSVVDVAEGSFIVHNSLLEQAVLKGASAKPLNVVGVSETELYWRDVRRVLFSGESYRVLARLTVSGVKNTWRPVKLTEVLAEAVPTLSADLASGARVALTAFATSDLVEDPTANVDAISACLLDFAVRVGKAIEATVDTTAVTEMVSLSSSAVNFTDRKDRNAAFDAVMAVMGPGQRHLSREELAELREASLLGGGFDVTGKFRSEATAPPVPESNGTPQEDALIEAEFVAIYW